jgi:hypothetical protein
MKLSGRSTTLKGEITQASVEQIKDRIQEAQEETGQENSHAVRNPVGEPAG